MDEVIKVWREYLDNIHEWQELVKHVEPKQTSCGPVYELPNPIDRPNESFAVADMRHVKVTEPHYHGEVEIYFVLQGSGLIFIGGEKKELYKGSVVVIPSNTAHFTIPKRDLVLAVVNTPPFQQQNYIVLNSSNKAVQFDKDQYEQIIKEEANS